MFTVFKLTLINLSTLAETKRCKNFINDILTCQNGGRRFDVLHKTIYKHNVLNGLNTDILF